MAPGVFFAEDDDVAPDVVWVSSRRVSEALGEDGTFHAAPELIVEVLSPGLANQKRDRETKLKLYSRRGVDEYWILDWQRHSVEIYRRKNVRLVLVTMLSESDTLTTPLLTGFSYRISELFAGVPQSARPK
jgi:Uma2 family endonuclease